MIQLFYFCFWTVRAFYTVADRLLLHTIYCSPSFYWVHFYFLVAISERCFEKTDNAKMEPKKSQPFFLDGSLVYVQGMNYQMKSDFFSHQLGNRPFIMCLCVWDPSTEERISHGWTAVGRVYQQVFLTLSLVLIVRMETPFWQSDNFLCRRNRRISKKNGVTAWYIDFLDICWIRGSDTEYFF